MKIAISEIRPNPFKKKINGGKLDEETIAKIRANIQELGLMGALPVFKRDGQYHLVAGHHRLEALKRQYGKDHKIEVVVHDYSEENTLRGMVIENLTQRNGEFREELENVVLVRDYLKNHPELSGRSAPEKSTGGRPPGTSEPGSSSEVARWINKNGEVMHETKIKDLLRINDSLAPELLEKVTKASHSVNLEDNKDVLPVKDASVISTIKDHEEQRAITEIIKNEELNQRDRIEMIQKFKALPEEDRREVVEGRVALSSLQKAVPDALSTGEMSLTFNKRAAELVTEMRALRSTLSQFRRERLFEQFSPKQRASFRDRLSAVRKEYGELVKELEDSLEVLS